MSTNLLREFQPSYWRLNAPAIKQLKQWILEAGTVSDMAQGLLNMHREAILSTVPRPGDEKLFNEAKAAVEDLLAVVGHQLAPTPPHEDSSPSSDRDHNMPIDNTSKNELDLQQILKLFYQFLDRRPQAIPLTQDVIKYMHLASYQKGLDLYRNQFGDRFWN